MDLKTRKLNLIEYLMELEDKSIFNRIESFIGKENLSSDNPFSPEQLRERIRKSEEDYRSGRVVSQEELEKKFDTRQSPEKINNPKRRKK